MNKAIISFFILGLTFGSGPCLASCGPIILSYIAGTRKNVAKGLGVYILFSLGRIFVYIALSLLVFFFGKFIMEKLLFGFSKYVLIIGGTFIFLVGLLLALGKKLELKFCNLLQKNILVHDKKSIIMLGLIIGILPCAPLLAIFSSIVLTSKSWFDSLLYSLSFGIGTFVSPLIFLVIFVGLIPSSLIDKSYNRIFNLVCGLIIMFLGSRLIMRAF